VQHHEPQVGVGVIVLREGLVLLGKRLGSHGAGTWALPGGHLEFGESVEECASREVKEETGLHLQSVVLGPYTSNVFPVEHKHYVTLFAIGECAQGEPQVLEPTKCSSWQWFRWSELPQPLFAPLASLVSSGYVPQNAA
jgi:8-oxo-dGTP diphosphatase